MLKLRIFMKKDFCVFAFAVELTVIYEMD